MSKGYLPNYKEVLKLPLFLVFNDMVYLIDKSKLQKELQKQANGKQRVL